MEPACFLRLFKGCMFVHLGKRDDDEKKNSTKLFIVQHEDENETALHEVPCRIDSLRRCVIILSLSVQLNIFCSDLSTPS